MSNKDSVGYTSTVSYLSIYVGLYDPSSVASTATIPTNLNKNYVKSCLNLCNMGYLFRDRRGKPIVGSDDTKRAIGFLLDYTMLPRTIYKSVVFSS